MAPARRPSKSSSPSVSRVHGSMRVGKAASISASRRPACHTMFVLPVFLKRGASLGSMSRSPEKSPRPAARSSLRPADST